MSLYVLVTCRWPGLRQLVEAGVLPQLIHVVLHPFGF